MAWWIVGVGRNGVGRNGVNLRWSGSNVLIVMGQAGAMTPNLTFVSGVMAMVWWNRS